MPVRSRSCSKRTNTTYSYVYSFDGEGALTSAIDYVISDELPKLYMLEGHGEAELPAEFRTQIEKENIELDTFSLLSSDGVPEDADAVLIYAPESDISAEEADMLIGHLTDGGKLLVMAGPTEDGTLTNLYKVLSTYGVEAADGIIVEGDREYYAFQQPYILLPEISSPERFAARAKCPRRFFLFTAIAPCRRIRKLLTRRSFAVTIGTV